MKSKAISKIVIFLTAFLILSSCSEFLLIPITVDYPFDKDSPSSPSEYEIDIDEGLGLLKGLMAKDVSKTILENQLKSQYPGADVTVSVTSSEMSLDNILELITGVTVSRKIDYTATIKQDGLPDITKDGEETITVSICDFFDGVQTVDPEFNDEGVRLTIVNVINFCKMDEKEKKEQIDHCKLNDLTTDERKSCTHVMVRHENTSISIMLAEVEELKDYKKFLDKIYSATLNDITFTILEKPDVPVENTSFVLEAELFAQPVSSFKADGTKCDSSSDEGCVSKGVDFEGNIENYFSDDDKIKERYLVGVFGTSTFGDSEKLELLYTYEGKDILQKSIKHLDFQIGAKSFYLFFPGAQRPTGKLTADIKAKLLFNVEPL
ncbi:MAG TPA: hypothetical protein PLD55_11255 [bacterium]|nr:hypothetical protein [bacterium]HQM85245.1 hypothetical protein [bacterium]